MALTGAVLGGLVALRLATTPGGWPATVHEAGLPAAVPGGSGASGGAHGRVQDVRSPVMPTGPAPAPQGGRSLARLVARARQAGNPVWEGGRPHLFYEGPARTVELAGDFTDWYLVPMQPVGGQPGGRPGLWEISPNLPPDAVVSYRLRVDGHAMPDPLNPRATSGLGLRFSVVLGPEAPGREPPADDIPSIAPRRLVIQSRNLGRRVTARIWVPRTCGRDSPCPTLYVADGPDYTGEGHLPAILAAEEEAGRIPAAVLVAVDPPPDPILRTAELLPGVEGDAWPRFLAEELVPAVEERFGAVRDRADRGLLGLSAGAAGMLEAALRHPHLFGVVLAQSPAALPPVLDRTLAGFPRQGTFPRIWLTWGRYERNVFGLDVAADGRRLYAALQQQGFKVAGGERNSGHTMAMWRRDLPGALEWAWGRWRARSGSGSPFRRLPAEGAPGAAAAHDSGET